MPSCDSHGQPIETIEKKLSAAEHIDRILEILVKLEEEKEVLLEENKKLKAEQKKTRDELRKEVKKELSKEIVINLNKVIR